MFRDNPLLSRIMALLLLGGCIAAVSLGAVMPVVEYRQALRQEISRAEALIAQYRARRIDVKQVRNRLEQLRRDHAARASFVVAQTPTLAAARLQSRVKALTEAAGARLISIQVVTSPARQEEFSRVTVRAQMIASTRAIRQIFHALESGTPAILLDNLMLAARAAPTRTGLRGERSGGAAPEESATLTVRYDAYGFLWNGGSPT